MGRFSVISLEQIETTIDDMSPERFPRVIALLLKFGARDAWISPIVMKQGRPGHCLTVLCTSALAPGIQSIIFEETTSIGLRQFTVARYELVREVVEVLTEYGRVEVKVSKDLDGRILNTKPELSQCAALADAKAVPLKHVISAAEVAFAMAISEAPQD